MKADQTSYFDKERQSLFYILSGNTDLYQKKDFIYDSKYHLLIPYLRPQDGGTDFSGSARALVRLGSNLYNGESSEESNVSAIFGGLDEQNRMLALNAIKIRFM